MRLINKYKLLSKFKGITQVSNRVLNFKRPKWNSLKKLVIRKKIISKLSELYKQNVSFGWEKAKKNFKNKISLNRLLLIKLQNNKRKRSKLLRSVSNNKNDKLHSFFFKNFFEIDFFLYSVCGAKTSYEAKKLIESKSVFKNFNSVCNDLKLSSGDILSFNTANYEYFSIKNRYNISESVNSYYEYDYYMQSFVILKNFSDVNKKDMFLVNSTFSK